MDLTRRDALRRGAAAALILGFPLTAWAEENGPPPWLVAARKLMRTDRSHGIGLVVPDGKEPQTQFEQVLRELLDSKEYAVHELLSEAVFVCADATSLGAKAGETVVLIGTDGRRVAGTAVALKAGESKRLVAAASRLLRAGGLLEKRAKAATTDEVSAAIATVRKKGPVPKPAKKKPAGKAPPAPAKPRPAAAKTEGEKAHAYLLERFARCGTAVIAAAAATRSNSERKRLRAVVEAYHRSRQSAGLLGWAPFGVRWAQADPCPTCGMAISTDPGRRFLRLRRRGEPG